MLPIAHISHDCVRACIRHALIVNGRLGIRHQLTAFTGVGVQRLAAALLFATASAFGHGPYHEQLQHTDELIAAHPQDGQNWYHRGYLNLLHGEWQTTLVDLERADRLEPGKYATDWLRGQALMVAGKFEAAKSVLDDFLKRFPLHGGAQVTRARVLDKLEQHEAALVDFREALSKTANAEPELVQEVAGALVAQKHLEEAVALIDTHLKRLGASPALIMTALDLEIKLGRIDAALARVDAMQKTAPRPEPWMAKRASVLAQAGRIEDSKRAWKALFDHIETLPDADREAQSMQKIAEQATQALAALASFSQPENTPSHPVRTSSLR